MPLRVEALSREEQQGSIIRTAMLCIAMGLLLFMGILMLCIAMGLLLFMGILMLRIAMLCTAIHGNTDVPEYGLGSDVHGPSGYLDSGCGLNFMLPLCVLGLAGQWLGGIVTGTVRHTLACAHNAALVGLGV